MPSRVSAAIYWQGRLPCLPVEMQDQLDIAESMQQAGVHHVHQVREIQRAIGALGPAAIAAEEFSRAPVPQQSFHRLFEIHGHKLPRF